MTANPTRNNHNKMINPINTLKRGERDNNGAPSAGSGVWAMAIGSGVTVGVLVSVGAGKIKVIAGNGTSVVVAATVGVSV